MPKLKMKTHSGASKRFKKTASGRVKRGHAFQRHILTSKGTKKSARPICPAWFQKLTSPRSSG